MSHVIVGDNIVILPTLRAESIDASVTDPPYGIGFMGKKWDTFKPGIGESRIVPNKAADSDNPNLRGRTRGPASSPSAVEYDRSISGQRGFQTWTEAWAREVMRVLKPGGHLLVCGAPRSFHRMTCGLEDAGFEIRDCLVWMFGQGFPKSHNLDGDWEGWGTALKPAWEPIIVARKPIDGTVAENVLKFSTGAINVDACRVGNATITQHGRTDSENTSMSGRNYAEPAGRAWTGRWPANLIHDGSDEVMEYFPDAPGQLADASNSAPSAKTSNTYGAMARSGEASFDDDNNGTVGFKMKPGARRLDSGSASRFFYCAKASKEDREDDNNHPTVKPTALMRYLVKLVTPPNGIVLDPFLGSGSTGKAAILEGFDFVGIEREKEYALIAERRIAAAIDRLREESRQQIMDFA